MKIESPFSIDDGEMRFVLSLESNSIKAHSVMDDNKGALKTVLDHLKNDSELVTVLMRQLKTWKENHK